MNIESNRLLNTHRLAQFSTLSEKFIIEFESYSQLWRISDFQIFSSKEMSMSPPYSKEYHRRRKEVLLRARDGCKRYGIVFSGHELTTPVDSCTELANDQGSQH